MKSAKKPEIWFWKFFFEHTYQTWFFSLFIVYVREIRRCTASIEFFLYKNITKNETNQVW